MRASVLSAIAIVAAVGCAPKEKQPEAASAPPVITATTPDSAAKAMADSITADSAKRAATKTGTKAGEKPLRDSAFGPKFKVDSNGKVIPIKKP